MKKLLMSLCTFLVAAAPLVDMSSRSAFFGWGESEYPNEEDYA